MAHRLFTLKKAIKHLDLIIVIYIGEIKDRGKYIRSILGLLYPFFLSHS